MQGLGPLLCAASEGLGDGNQVWRASQSRQRVNGRVMKQRQGRQTLDDAPPRSIAEPELRLAARW